MKKLVVILFLLLPLSIWSQETYYGIVKDQEFKQAIPFAPIQLTTSSGEKINTSTDEFGRFEFKNISENSFSLTIRSSYFNELDTLIVNANADLGILYLRNIKSLKPVDVYVENPFETGAMRTIEGVTITHAKKTQKISVDKLNANKATNNAREVYAKVPGLTIWESDGGGLQLGIGTRGLNPSRSAHINIRQNGYDISADPLGYPETYYTPPVQALKSINFIRGAASLQFGPQFGGMLNFVLKDASKKKIAYSGEHTYGAYNLMSTYNQLSGTLGKRFSYFGYGLYKRGDGWRANSNFEQYVGYGRLSYALTEKMSLSVEHTHMSYLAQQPGGLTDALFNADPRQSIRERNWFKVNWNISALDYYWIINHKTKLSLKVYGVNAQRFALGNLDKISRLDDYEERDLIKGNFQNYAAELRFLKKYPIGKKQQGILSTGVRYYQGTTLSQQGYGTAGYDANFTFNNPDNLEQSDYTFPSKNIAAFAENIYVLSEKLSISFGIRMEHIETMAEGYYREQVYHPLTNELLFDTTIFENDQRVRTIFLGGIGFSYQLKEKEIYGNIAQNYRAINFSDIRISNPNQRVDENITDERGFNVDLGIRHSNTAITYDFGAFFLYYNNKIGVVNAVENNETIRLRTNVGLGYSTGIEAFLEKRFELNDSTNHSWSIFGNLSAIYARYGNLDEEAYSNNFIEQVPPITIRTGFKYSYKKHSFSLIGAYVHRHYTDATNAEFDANAIAGVIPSYYVCDFSGKYAATTWLNLKYGINNFTNNKYFTRRATGYPGPGIIPSDGISFYLTVGLNF